MASVRFLDSEIVQQPFQTVRRRAWTGARSIGECAKPPRHQPVLPGVERKSGLHRQAHEIRQPIRLHRHCIIVEKDEDPALGNFCSSIEKSREI